jgi:hypothetical protein
LRFGTVNWAIPLPFDQSTIAGGLGECNSGSRRIKDCHVRTGASIVENPCKTNYKGHLLSGSAHKESAGTVEKWRPDNPTVDKEVVVFDPLNFPNRKFDTENEAIQHSIKYGEWIIDHPLALERAHLEDDKN